MEYTEKDILRIAKRHNNPKRTYLLVDPLQGKHIAVSPTAALEMMHTLGRKLHDKYPAARLVIGFAETATAIAAAAAEELHGCRYIHTTREDIPSEKWLFFSEEHSHASEQKLCLGKLSEYAENTDTVILIDDEISTGKTLINIVERLRSVKGVENKQIVAASIISRISDENLARLEAAGIISECLLKLPEEDYTSAVEKYDVHGAQRASAGDSPAKTMSVQLPDPRIGVDTAEYAAKCSDISAELCDKLSDILSEGDRILVLGTEECMYPALMLGKTLEDSGRYAKVMSHSTTRSPIGICTDEDYPITEGYMIRSFYEDGRKTYIYNIGEYDAAVVLTDGSNPNVVRDITGILSLHGCNKVVYIGR
ncbi:MAG: phosphoribosyltransferase domain-containing protein [Oscillospiraceae bacterium]|nr:phosphoribosyltransferase domain-containing protein [Oscillospiraceae bacterium]